MATSATEVFGRLGYRGTRTAEVAARAGMSTGLLFNYVESKEALFHLVFLHGFDLLSEPPPELPLPTPAPGETASLIERGLRRLPAPRFEAALATERPDDVERELREVVEERYELTARYWPLFAVIERCAAEMPDIEEVYFRRARPRYFTALTRYLQQRMDGGLLRRMPDAAVAARFIVEGVTWFAWHRRGDRDARQFDDETAKRTVTEFVCAALTRRGGRG